MFNLILLAGLCLLSACAPKAADDCQFVQNVYGQKIVHKTLPVILYVSTDVPQEFFEIMQSSVAEINRDRTYITLFRGDVIGGARQRNLTNEVYFENNWPDDRKYEQAVTHSWWAGEHIGEVDVAFNTDDFNPVFGNINLKTLATHEFLHALGMRHQKDDENGIMYPELGYYQVRGMTEREYKNLECAYEK